MTETQAVLEKINGEWIADLTEEMVRIPSVTMDEAAVCIYYEQQLRGLGLEVDVREVTPGRPNLYARIQGRADGPALMLNGHLDTIPNQTDQSCYREDDLLFGRGTTDMKGGMAAILGAARALIDADISLAGDLWLTAVVGHEEPEAEKDGPRALIEDINNNRIAADRIIIVEGPDLLWVMSMGSMVFTIRLTPDNGGRHTQYVAFEENPIRFAGDLVTAVLDRQAALDAGDVHPLAGAERIDLGILHAGDYFNRTPVSCRFTGTRRWAPGKDAGGILEELRNLVAPIAAAGGMTAEVTMEHEREPFETPLDDPVVAAVRDAHHHLFDEDPEAVGKRIVGDANLYVHGSGVPTIYYGPSNETAHADIENVSMTRLTDSARVYALAAINYCGLC
ncbi:MAG: M20/M25/M40 family metallo-hydrolase [Planctomycetaceae bacterium]